MLAKTINNLYEVKLHNGKCIEPKKAMVRARDEVSAKRKAESLHRGYRAADVHLVPSK